MKSKKNLLEQLNSLPHFSKTAVLQLASQAGFAESTVDTYISRFLKHGEIIRLKNGVYVSDNFLKTISTIFPILSISRTSYVRHHISAHGLRFSITISPLKPSTHSLRSRQ